MSNFEVGECFDVECTKCKASFRVIRNWGGGIRRVDDGNCNPVSCTCGSKKLKQV